MSAQPQWLPDYRNCNPLPDDEIADIIMDADLAHTILTAAVYAVRNMDMGYLRREIERHLPKGVEL